MRRRALLAALLLFAGGCADLLGLGEFGDRDASAADATGDATSDVVDAAPEAAPDADASCTSAPADDVKGIFVATSGSTDDSTCGTKTVPCASIQVGIERAHVIAGKSIVYVSRGTYAESISLYAGLTLEGGWDVLDDGQTKSWVQACTDPASAVVVRPTNENKTVSATNLGGAATIETLTIASKTAAVGESLYAVFAVGATTTLAMNDVVVQVAAGGDGLAGATGITGDAGGAGCTPDLGDAGAPGTIGTGAEAGLFDEGGWEPSSGTVGGDGTSGIAGLAGLAGACLSCGTCQSFLGCSFKTNGSQTCGGIGYAGCGGAAGTAGGAGGGGGSSIGVYAWDATVTLDGCAVTVGGGGAGGSGGAGGNGGPGGAGQIGDAGSACGVSCDKNCNPVQGDGPGGDAGGAGGAGGSGGSGGGGAGGCAYALFQGGSGSVTATSTSFAHGDAGAGGGPDGAAGAPGAAADRFP